MHVKRQYNYRTIRSTRLRVIAASLVLLSLPCWSAQAQEDPYTDLTTDPPADPPEPNSETVPSLLDNLPANTPAYFKKTYPSLMAAPLPKKIYNQGGIPPLVPRLEIDKNPFGKLGSYQPDGPTVTANNAFFQELGTNGRSCVTCHQPPSGMSISLRNINKRFNKTGGKDPLFAAVDGANCPNLVPAEDTSGSIYGGRKGMGKKGRRAAHSLLLTKGLIRIALPVPANAEYRIEVIQDPTSCNTTPAFNSLPDGTKIVSVFRRPVISAHLDFKTTTLFPGPGGNSGNIMWDGREPTLFTQAVSATMGHAQALQPPTQAQLDQIVQFERRIFSAQYSDNQAGNLAADGANGGPVALAGTPPGQFGIPEVFDQYDGWAAATGRRAADRQSIARGQEIFNNKQFQISDVAGFNDFPGITNPATGTCGTCHNVKGSGSDILPASQRDIGIGGHAQAASCGVADAASDCGPAPATDLPRFRLTCPAGSFLWDANLTTVITNDPAKALITGKCRDIGQTTVPTARGLASREPYFHDGSARTIPALIDIYDKRFDIGLTAGEKKDLANFLLAM